MRAAFGLASLVLGGGCTSSLPTRVPEVVTHPERLRPGTAGTVSILDNASPAGCQWLRADPGSAPEEVHQFAVPCADMSLHWSRDGERAVVFFYPLSAGTVDAWEADLATGALWRLVPPPGEELLTGYMAPDGAITLKTTVPKEPSSVIRRALNGLGLRSGEPCAPGMFRGYRSSRRGTWQHVDDAALDCSGAVLGDWNLGADYTWQRPGVQETPDPARPGWLEHSRGRGDFLLVPGAWQRHRVGPDGVREPSFGNGRIEFWPAPVLPEWPVPAANDASSEW